MQKYFRSIMIAICFASIAFLIGCKVPAGENIFQTHPTDTAITTAILEAMLNDENLSTLTVHVETTNGVVLLSGYVKTIRQSDTSEDVAQKTAGVKSVQNNIIVRK